MREKVKRLWKVTCCRDCKGGWNKRSLQKGLPKMATANNKAMGMAPH